MQLKREKKLNLMPSMGYVLLRFDWEWQLEQSKLDDEYFMKYAEFEAFGRNSEELGVKVVFEILQASVAARCKNIRALIEDY